MIPLKDIHDTVEFWRGTRFRKYNVGLNVQHKMEDYYEYMLAENPSEPEYFLLINVVGYKSGSVLALVKVSEVKNRDVVTAGAVKNSLGVEDVYVLEDEFL